MFEILFFIALGIFFGVITGLIPGVHPNLIVLSVPLLMAFSMDPLVLLAFIVSLAVTNSITDFIPSILTGAPDSGNELSILPGHRLLMRGYGYQAVKLTVVGGVGSVILCMLFLPLLILFLPSLYSFINPYIWLLLVLIVLVMILTEKGSKKIVAAVCFFLAGFIGMLSNRIPIDSTLILFPILSGLFGMGFLVLQLKKRVSVPPQKSSEVFVSKKLTNRSVLLGTLGGIVSGFLPGVGSSQIATLATVDKNDYSFLTTMGAITTSNIILSILSLFLIGRIRSGVAVVIDQFMVLTLNEVVFVAFVALISCGAAAIITLLLTKRFLKLIEKIDYSKISLFILLLLTFLIIFFTGIYGLFLAVICCSLGIFANLAGIKRGNLMGVLILPVILFYIGV
jgi:putative membrane protein